MELFALLLVPEGIKSIFKQKIDLYINLHLQYREGLNKPAEDGSFSKIFASHFYFII